MGVIAFISYSTKDKDIYPIKNIADKLTDLPEIDDVLYWEEDMIGDMYDYMSNNIEKCDVFLLFCSENAKKSPPVNKEWKAADKLGKYMIPVFIDSKYIPLLIHNRGVQFEENKIGKTIKSIYDLILKKFNISPQKLDMSAKKKEKRYFRGLLKEKIEVTESESRFNKYITFRGAQITQSEAEILQELEKLNNRQFRIVGRMVPGAPTPLSNYQMSFTAESNYVTRIFFRNCGLRSLPMSIGNLKYLQTLNCMDNQLTAIPESIGNLTSLQKLNYKNNKLKTLSESIGNLDSLNNLWLNNNKLTSLPESIGNLKTLENLSLGNNRLKNLPESIGELSSLESLDLRNNQLTTLPESIGELSSLESLDLRNNSLTTLPESIGFLNSLNFLWLSNNKLMELPESMGNLRSLKKLYLSGNRLTIFPESMINLTSLEIVQLGNNNLKILPNSIGNLKALKDLTLNNNQLNNLPESIVSLKSLKWLNLKENPLDLKLKSQTQQIINILELNGVKIRR